MQYTFREPKTVSGVRVQWFDDTPAGGGCALPQSWKVFYRDGEQWKPVKEARPRGAIPQPAVGELAFEPVKTSALRLEATLQDGKSAGVLEWAVLE